VFDLVIVNYNSSEFLHDCLASIGCSNNGSKLNVFVSDNGSEEPIDYMQKTFDDIAIIRNKQNLGFSKAINAILSTTSSPYIVLLNPDTIVLPDHFWESVAAFMDAHPDVGILGPGVVNPDGSMQGSARSFPRIHSLFFGRRSLLTKILPNSRFTRANILSNNASASNPLEVDWVSGACMVVRRKALEEVGMLDDRFFMYWEDIDWCKRMWDSGWKVVYWPAVKIMHHVGGSSDSIVIRPVLEFHKSSILYFKKHITLHRHLLLPPIIAAIYLRFFALLFSQAYKMVFDRRKKKPNDIYETAATEWLYRACIEKDSK